MDLPGRVDQRVLPGGIGLMPLPARMAWAVELLDVAPDDRILEVGCGTGVAVAAIAARLRAGHVTAIDRSATAISRAAARVADHVAAGRVALHQVDLAGYRPGGVPFDKVVAVNVNVFWRAGAGAACEALAAALRPGGVVRLVYEGPAPGAAGDRCPAVAASLAASGFETDVVHHPEGAMACVSGWAGRRPGPP